MFLKQNPNDTRSDELLLSQEVKQKLLELQNKGIDINELLLEFLEKREPEIVQEKEKLAAEIHNQTQPKVSRYIPAKKNTVRNVRSKPARNFPKKSTIPNDLLLGKPTIHISLLLFVTSITKLLMRLISNFINTHETDCSCLP